jgi:hypothetical protein
LFLSLSPLLLFLAGFFKLFCNATLFLQTKILRVEKKVVLGGGTENKIWTCTKKIITAKR